MLPFLFVSAFPRIRHTRLNAAAQTLLALIQHAALPRRDRPLALQRMNFHLVPLPTDLHRLVALPIAELRRTGNSLPLRRRRFADPRDLRAQRPRRVQHRVILALRHQQSILL